MGSKHTLGELNIRKQWHPLRDSYPFSMKQMPCIIRLYRSRILMRSSLKKKRRKNPGDSGKRT